MSSKKRIKPLTRHVLLANIFCLMCFVLLVPRALGEMRIITPKYRLATEIVTQVTPLAEGVYIKEMAGEIVLKGEPARLTELVSLIQRLDRPSRNLLIELRRQGQKNNRKTQASFEGQYEKDGNRVVINQPQQGKSKTGSYSTTTIGQLQQSGTESSGQQARGVEGHPVFIGTGTSSPVVVKDRWGRVIQSYQQDALQGFYATVHFIGDDRVSIEISASNDKRQQNTQAIDVEGVTTRTGGKVGQWLPIGSFTSQGSSQDRGLGQYKNQNSQSFSGYEIRVTHLGG